MIALDGLRLDRAAVHGLAPAPFASAIGAVLAARCVGALVADAGNARTGAGCAVR